MPGMRPPARETWERCWRRACCYRSPANHPYGQHVRGRRNTVVINHSAPGIRMNGPGKPPCLTSWGDRPVGLGRQGVVDFSQNSEKTVTVARVHPNADKLLVMRGLLVGSMVGTRNNLGCSVTAIVKPAESGRGDRFIRRQTEYGNHLSWFTATIPRTWRNSAGCSAWTLKWWPSLV